jgi:hypothetical protein
MKCKYFLFLIVFISFLVACKSRSKKEDSIIVSTLDKKDLINTTITIGPEFDSVSSKAYGECDCCMSDLSFIDENKFIYVTYCLDNTDYLKGKYEVKNNSIILNFDSMYVNRFEPIDEIDSKEKVEYRKEKMHDINTKVVWKSFWNKNNFCIYSEGAIKEYGYIDSTYDSKKYIADFKSDTIYKLLFE